MSFRKRNVRLTDVNSPNHPTATKPSDDDLPTKHKTPSVSQPGIRPSPLDGRPTTSTGTLSLDALLAGHAGLALGNSILLEESGATDYAGTLIRYFAAEGIVQGHQIHVIGMNEAWSRDLPGLVGVADANNDKREEESRRDKTSLKIAWRYEKLSNNAVRASPLPDRGPAQDNTAIDEEQPRAFCHAYDLTKRLLLHSPTSISLIPIRSSSPAASPFTAVIESLRRSISASGASMIHRIVVPSLLSPAFYPPSSSMPQNVLQFLHSLRALLRQYSTQACAIISLPITLYPRETGLTRWIELLSDGVLELTPFPHSVDTGPSLSTSGAATAQEEKPQGIAKLHRLPVFHERGGGGAGSAGVGDDLAFTVTRKRFVIKPFSLPPIDGDTDAQKGDDMGKPTKLDIEF